MNNAPMSSAQSPLSSKPVLMVLVAIAAGMATLSVAAPEVAVQPVRSKATAAPAYVSEGMDWSRVEAKPVDTGMSIAAYDR
jgi:hypothetical protein